MRVVDHKGQEQEQWRPGVLTRMRISALTGAAQLCVFEQWCDPGCGAPAHLHTGEEGTTVIARQSVIVPTGQRHGFRNTGEMVLHLEAILAAPMIAPVTQRD